MEFAKFQIKMAMIKRCDLQRFYIFTWHLREFWAHIFFSGRFFSWRAIFFVAGNSSRVACLRIAAFLAQPSSPHPGACAASFDPHPSWTSPRPKPRPSWTSPHPDPLRQSFTTKLGGARAWRSRAGGRNAARVTRAWGRSRFAKPVGLGIYAKSRPLNVKLCKLQNLNAKPLDITF